MPVTKGTRGLHVLARVVDDLVSVVERLEARVAELEKPAPRKAAPKSEK